MPKLFIVLLAAVLSLADLEAQNLYTVQVGTFLEVRGQDFDELRPLGFVYGNVMEGNLTQVFLGNYSDLTKAEGIANQLRIRGFKNAMVLQRPIDAGQGVVVIQLTTTTNGKPIDWAGLDRAGDLFVETDDQLIKVVTGIYPDVGTAQQLLPAIRQLGYQDAFVKSINNARLVPITAFESGIKKPLIPIDLTNEPPVAPAFNTGVVNTNNGGVRGGVVVPNNSNQNNAPGTYGSSPVNPVGTNASLPAPAVGANLPSIRNRFKRASVTNLQSVLKEKGYYTAAIDGYYGNGTNQAYLSAWDGSDLIRKYRLLSSLTTHPASDPVLSWPEVDVLLAIAEEMSAGMGDSDLAQLSISNRQQLYRSTGALTPAAASRANAWALTLWENLDKWAIEDPLHAQVMSAFRLAYFQTQVRLEDFYMDRGLSSDIAKELAVATLQNLIGAELERFL